MDQKYDVLGGYVPAFVQHLNDTRARLGLRTVSQTNCYTGGIAREGKGEEEETTDLDSDAVDLSDWTSTECDAFFRALSVYSRWRPDLIAACVQTRTEWEVGAYLEALEEGATSLATRRGDLEDWDVEMRADDGSSSDTSSHSGSDHRVEEGIKGEVVCEPALEVSQAWIELEERMAAWITQQEHPVFGEADTALDAEATGIDVPVARKRGRPCNAGKGNAHDQVRGQTSSEEGRFLSTTSTAERRRFRNDSSPSVRKRKALMGHLEVPHLLVLDNILREGEDAIKGRENSPEGSLPPATSTKPGDERTSGACDMEASSLSDRISVPQGTGGNASGSSNVVIDPVLLAPSEGVDTTGRQSQSILEDCVASSSLHDASPQSTSLGVSSHPQPSNMFTFQLVDGTLTNPNLPANIETDLSSFSPRSRRRIQKRLYMRRKRASLRENSEGVVVTGVEKLKPGKKAKLERSKVPAVSTSAPCSVAPSDAETEFTDNVPKRSKGGLTLPYKLRAQFAELGIDAAYLRGQCIDLLNLSALGRLMGLYSSLEYGDEEADTSIVQSINAELIQFLQAAMVSFVTDVIHRAIVWKEREVRLKQRSQAWGHGGQITIGAIQHAVEVIGLRYHSHKEFFKTLGAFHELPTEPPGSREPSPSDETVDPDAEADPPGLSPHQDVYTPSVYPPCTSRIGPLACFTRTYEREATRTRRELSVEAGEEELMSDATDLEALEVELREEDEVDVLDMELGGKEEVVLRHKIRLD